MNNILTSFTYAGAKTREYSDCSSAKCSAATQTDDDFEALLDSLINDDDDTATATDHNQPASPTAPEPTAEERLDAMVGLRRVKREVRLATTLAEFRLWRKCADLDAEMDCRHHMLFLGGPGTGKTTVAKLIGEIYHRLDVLSSGHTVEVSRSDLVGEYIGQTEQNTLEAIKQARGGVLFIDEAYSLYSPSDSKDFGKEVMNALLPVLSEPQPDLIVILAGYEDKMQQLLGSNSGLTERFPLRLHFDDYTADELMLIASRLCLTHNYELTAAAADRLRSYMGEVLAERRPGFSNGRWVHNLMEHDVIVNMAMRVMQLPERDITPLTLRRIELEDVAAAIADDRRRQSQPGQRRAVGFVA